MVELESNNFDHVMFHEVIFNIDVTFQREPLMNDLLYYFLWILQTLAVLYGNIQKFLIIILPYRSTKPGDWSVSAIIDPTTQPL